MSHYERMEAPTPAADISKWRDEVDKIDDFFMHLLRRRLFFSKLLGDAKKQGGVDIEEPKREEAIITRLSRDCAELTRADVETVWKHIFELSKREQLQAYVIQ